MSAPLKILGRPSSINVRKVLCTAEEAGLSFEHEAQWGTSEAPTRSAEFMALNPNALVPVLIDEAGAIWESNAICRYLCDRAGRADLFPAAPAARARIDMWMDWQATELNGAWRYAFMGLVRRHPDFSDRASIAASAQNWNSMMRLLDRRLADTGAFIAGEAFTLADIVVGLSAHRWRSTPIDHAPVPAVRDWLARLDDREPFRRWTTFP
ncbi:MAG: glutathione S-transferase N-terminal domain-containing protein [Parvularculaceae bacterium]